MKKRKERQYNFLWKAIRKVVLRDWGWTVKLVAAILLGTALQFIPPFVLRNVVDTYMIAGHASGVWPWALLYLLLMVTGQFNNALQGYASTRLGSYVLLEMRMDMARRLEKLPMSFFQKNAVGNVMSYFTADMDAIETIFSSGLLVLIINLFQILGLVAAVLVLSPAVFVVMCVVFPFLFLMTNVYRKVNLRMQSELRSRTADVGAFLQEVYNGIRTIKVFGREKIMTERAQPLLEAWYRPVRGLAALSSSFPVIRQTLWAVMVTLVVWVGGPTGLPFSVGLTAGTLAALMDLVMRIFWPVEALSHQIFTLQQAVAGLRRISSYFHECVEERHYSEAMPHDTLPVVRVEGLYFGYHPDRPVLNDISFTVLPGSKVALAGRTGAGKTTLLHLLAGLYEPQQGRIMIGDREPFHMKPEERRRWLGVVPQQAYVLDGTVYDNITLREIGITREMVERAVRIVGLHDDIMLLPNGYDTPLGEGETQLSFGQSQLLCLARAIVADPAVLLLDELTAGMDMLTERRILDVLRNISKGRTILTISHRISGIIDADEVHILNGGHLVESGNIDTLMQQEGWYAMMLRLEEMDWENTRTGSDFS